MSKLYSKYIELKKQNPDTIFLFKSGIFFLALQDDATILSNELKLKITNLSPDVQKCGFPVSREEHYFRILKAKNLDFKIIDDTYGIIENYSDYINNNKLKNIVEKIININFDDITVFVRLAYKYQYISKQNYETWCSKITDICNMLGNYIRKNRT